MRRLFTLFLTMQIILGLILPAAAQTEPVEISSEISATEVQTTPTPETEAPENTLPQPTAAAPTEPDREEPTENPDRIPEESTVPSSGSGDCEHSWMYVEVPPTCTEYGAKGYVCIYCEGVTDAQAIEMIPHKYDNSCDPDCNVCGAEHAVNHRFSSVWSKNSTQHWHACSVCGAKNDVGSHYPGPAATEEKAQYCLTCGLMMMPQKAHTHKFSETYQRDESEHWYACEGCGERKSAALHSYDSPCDSDCNICGYISEKTHDYGLWQSDENGHWNICSLCGESAEPEAHIPDAEVTQTGAQSCSICGFEIFTEVAHVHKASATWCADEIKHWKLCDCTERMEEELHSWDEGGETDEESMRYICTVCGAEKTEMIPEEAEGFSWWIPAAIAGLLGMALRLAGMILLRKRTGKYGN